ncbi:MAG: putative glycosyl hydrolase [Herbinix sp.]|jgi:GNAT superfamily N-acetyltransferase|nr:putative glycosyl hydrolase [Herbinix sp.]
MELINFDESHIPMALQLAKENYEMERKHVTMLPEIVTLPDMRYFIERGTGFAAVEGERLMGYLCAYPPRDDDFGTTNVRGTYVPVHAHGVSLLCSGEERARIYSLLYQAAAEKWVEAGIRSHTIALYTHDQAGVKSFFYNGFGLRCLDLIRSLDEIPTAIEVAHPDHSKLEYTELFRDEWIQLLDQHNALLKHLGSSPSFLYYMPFDEAGLYNHAGEDVRYFAAKVSGRYVAYIKTSHCGENFATEVDVMLNICGAFCEPEYRGTGVYHNLLCHVMKVIKSEGYLLLGVDCESFNPTARGFWTKYFTVYTYSVVRRIDEKAVDMATTTKLQCNV